MFSRYVAFLLFCVPLSLLSITRNQLFEEYSIVFLLQCTDTVRMHVVPVRDLSELDTVMISQNELVYSQDCWHNLISYWVGMDPSVLGSQRLRAMVYDDPAEHVIISLFFDEYEKRVKCIFDPPLTFQEAWLIRNELLQDCVESFKQEPCMVEKDDFEFTQEDEQEIMLALHNQPECSAMHIYARRLGVSLLLFYLSCKDRFASSMSYLSSTIFGKSNG